MDFLQKIIDFLTRYFVEIGIPVGDENVPLMVIILLGIGTYLTLRLGFVQVTRLRHGAAVASGKYDDPDDEGDVTHFQALTTALSATVGIGNIAGVALAIHWGGPGALFWMWVTAALGMATKYSEVTLAQKYRVHEHEGEWAGTVSGGPMYYIERGLGPNWKWMAVLFAVLLGFTAFLTGNGVQANTVADNLETQFSIPTWVSGLVTSGVVAAVILGGITRIGRVTAVLAPLMAVIYVLGALIVIFMNVGEVGPTFALIFREAFNPSAGVAGTGVGAFLVTLMYGVRRGLFSNEAGQGSAPIAHSAAKTDEPVSEGVVALLEPFIDTIIICTMTGLLIIMTGVWHDRFETEITLSGGDMSYRAVQVDGGYEDMSPDRADPDRGRGARRHRTRRPADFVARSPRGDALRGRGADAALQRGHRSRDGDGDRRRRADVHVAPRHGGRERGGRSPWRPSVAACHRWATGGTTSWCCRCCSSEYRPRSHGATTATAAPTTLFGAQRRNPLQDHLCDPALRGGGAPAQRDLGPGRRVSSRSSSGRT